MKGNFLSKIQGAFGGQKDAGMKSKKIDIISRNDYEYQSAGGNKISDADINSGKLLNTK